MDQELCFEQCYYRGDSKIIVEAINSEVFYLSVFGDFILAF